MAFPDTVNVTRLGEKQGGSTDPLELFLKKFSGEVLVEFRKNAKISPYVRKRTLTNAKVAQFPVIGGAVAKYHTPGQSVYDEDNAYIQTIAHTEKLIYADKKLIAGPVAIDEWDELINHYEVRSAYAEEFGQALSQEWDFIALKLLNVASNASANLSGGFGGSRVETNDESAAEIKAGLASAAQKMDEKFVPETGRVAAVSPLAFYNLLNDKEVIHGDYNPSSNGSLSSGQFAQYLGFTIIKSQNLASSTFRTNHTGVTNQPNGAATGNVYVTNATNTLAFAWHPQALGAVQVKDVTFEAEYSMEYQAHMMLTKFIMGMGVLRPECVVALANDA